MATEGDLPMEVQWYFRGSNVSTRLGVSTVRVGQRTNLLVIDSVTPENGGQYTCRASNAAGVAEYSADLFVKGTFSVAHISHNQSSSKNLSTSVQF